MPDEPRVLPEAWLPLPEVSFDAPQPAAPPPSSTAPEVGAEVQAYCPSPRCSTDTVHTIISTYEDEIRRVQCVTCGEVHAFRRPRGGAAPQAAAATPSWDELMVRFSDADRNSAQPYSIRPTYQLNDLLQHPVFGVGVVIELLLDLKVNVSFRDGARILVHGRG